MNAAATAPVTTYAGCLAQLNLITNGIDKVPSRFSEEIVYTDSAEKQEELPRVISLNGSRTDVAGVFDKAFPVEEGDEVVKSSKASSFVGRVRALDALLDRDVEDVMLGLTSRPPDTFESFDAWREFDKFIIGSYGSQRLRDVMRADNTSQIMAEESFETAKLADAENRPEAVANAFFISGRLSAALKDVGMSHTDAALAFETAAPLFASAKRFVAVAICYELMAEMRELRNMNSDEARLKAADAWLKAVGRGKELKVDAPSLSMVIFRGMWNAQRVNHVPSMISFLELSAEQYVKAGKYAEAADDYLRILNHTLPTFTEGSKDGWKVVDGRLNTLREYVRKAEAEGGLLQDLIYLSNDVHENAIAKA